MIKPQAMLGTAARLDRCKVVYVVGAPPPSSSTAALGFIAHVTGLLCKGHSSKYAVISLSVIPPLGPSLGASRISSLPARRARALFAHPGLHTEDGQLLHQTNRMGLRATWGPRWVPARERRGSGQMRCCTCSMLPTLYCTQFHAGASTEAPALYTPADGIVVVDSSNGACRQSSREHKKYTPRKEKGRGRVR